MIKIWEFIKSSRNCASLCISLVFLKIPACLYNSTMHSIGRVFYFFSKIALKCVKKNIRIIACFRLIYFKCLIAVFTDKYSKTTYHRLFQQQQQKECCHRYHFVQSVSHFCSACKRYEVKKKIILYEKNIQDYKTVEGSITKFNQPM